MLLSRTLSSMLLIASFGLSAFATPIATGVNAGAVVQGNVLADVRAADNGLGATNASVYADAGAEIYASDLVERSVVCDAKRCNGDDIPGLLNDVKAKIDARIGLLQNVTSPAASLNDIVLDVNAAVKLLKSLNVSIDGDNRVDIVKLVVDILASISKALKEHSIPSSPFLVGTPLDASLSAFIKALGKLIPDLQERIAQAPVKVDILANLKSVLATLGLKL